MTTRRRQSFAIVPTSTDWPPELADTDARAWRTNAATQQWLQDHGVEGRTRRLELEVSNVERCVAAIKAWTQQHHPSERCPNFPDNQWMNTSGLRSVEQTMQTRAWRDELERLRNE